jgi:predicted dinucleotide-binding enzyme
MVDISTNSRKVEESTNRTTCDQEHGMSSISIIGVGNMARAIADRALDGGSTVEVIGRDPGKAAALAEALGRGATARPIHSRPEGDVVVLAVPYGSTVPVITEYGDLLADKVIVDISNPFAPGGTSLLTPQGSSAAQQIQAALPEGAHVVKAFNTIFGRVLAALPGHAPLDVFLAGDDERAKKEVFTFIDSMELRPLDVGPLAMAGVLEQAGLLVVGVAGHTTGLDRFALGVTVFA